MPGHDARPELDLRRTTFSRGLAAQSQQYRQVKIYTGEKIRVKRWRSNIDRYGL